MPVIPQYNAGGPAQVRGPVLEQDKRNRLDTGAQLSALGNFANQIAGQTAPLQGLDPNMGQAAFQGMAQMGAGIKSIGQAIFDVREREAEARNYVDIQEAQTAMDREAGEFEKWKASNPDPRTWEKAWSDRAAAFSNGYFEGKEISPMAQEGIKARMSAFNQRQAVNVGVSAIKATTAQARESMMADYYRAIESGNAQAAGSLAEYGFKQGWIGEDDAVKMQINAQDAVESKQLEILQNQKNTALQYGDIESAKAAVEAMPLRGDEKALELATITERHGYSRMIEDAEDLIAENPEQAAKELSGEKFKDLRSSDKAALRDAAFRTMAQERAATVSGIKDDIKLGAVRTPKDLAGRDDFRSLTDRQKAEIEDYFKEGARNDISEFMTLQRSIRNYDPANDPRGYEREQFETAVALRFDGARAEELFATLEDAMSPDRQPVKPSQRVVSDIFSAMQKRYENGEIGEFIVTGDKIDKKEGPDGETVYTVPDPSGDFKEKGFFGTYSGRVIQLSERDRLRFEQGKTLSGDTYEDISAKEKAFGRFLEVQQTVERMVEAGELTEADEIQNKVNALMKGEIKGALARELQFDSQGVELPGNSYGTVSSGGFPDGSVPTDEELNEFLKDANY